ncbi:unnamed protein product [Gordionus sp. m RMFG-2023]|uniref:sphingosine-1-phosphate lyase 1-like isoform X1 n=1 Tax=Gordionus sp. m RMFG-2023 TaxID=3053472 RepID=UPI0030E1E077
MEYLEDIMKTPHLMLTIYLILIIYFTSHIYYQSILWFPHFKKKLYDIVLKAPIINNRVSKNLSETEQDIRKKLHQCFKNVKYINKIPENGVEKISILAISKEYRNIDVKYLNDGKISGCLYHEVDSNLIDIQTELYKMFAYSNPLHPDVYPSIMKMESEIVRMCCNLYGGDDNSCGTVTTGGTESILLACLAYRNYAKKSKGILNPEIIIADSAHAAFLKAGSYFNIQCKIIPTNKETFRLDPAHVRQAINGNTIAIVVSAPSYPHGIVDPIEIISEVGLEHDIPVHVDACLGGFLVPFLFRAGFHDVIPEEKLFKLTGVTSVSLDTHKYGFAPKGSSVILYNEKKYLHSQYFVATEWMGGMYPSQTLSGSRSGLNIALTWATLLYYGQNGYIESTRKIIESMRYLMNKIKELKGSLDLKILGDPKLNVIALGNDKGIYDVYDMGQEMSLKGWNLNYLQNPHGIHLCLTHVHTQPGVIDEFLNDLKGCDEILKNRSKSPKEQSKNIGALYCFAQSISDQTPLQDVLINGYLDGYYSHPREL